jgi:hypothetical protein
VPGREGASLPLAERRDPPADLPGADGRLQSLFAPRAVHHVSAWPAHQPQPRRGLPRPGPGLPRHRALRQGDAEAQGLGGTALPRGQGPAWPAAVPLAGAGERKYPSPTDRGGPESEAVAEQVQPRPALVAQRGRRGGPPGGATARHLTGVNETRPAIRLCSVSHPRPFFNGLEGLRDTLTRIQRLVWRDQGRHASLTERTVTASSSVRSRLSHALAARFPSP